MKTFRLLLLTLLLGAIDAEATTNYTATVTIPGLGLTNVGATIVIGNPMRVSDYTNRPAPLPTDLILLADPVGRTNANVTYQQLQTNLQSVITSTATNSISLFTNLWSGPSNSLPLVISGQSPCRQTFFSPTACAITGVTGKGSNTVNTSTMTLHNSAGTNWLLTLDPAILTRDGSRQLTVTNGQDFIVSLQYDPSTGHTNLVWATQL